MSNFFETLPEFTVLCMSLLSEKSNKVLKKLLPESPTSVWIMISRISRNSGPLLFILPICKIFEDFKFETDDPLVGDDWTCPCAHGVFDKLVPVLRMVLKKDSKVIETPLRADKKLNYGSQLDENGLEESWFGRLKYLLLGEWSDNNDLDETVQEMENIFIGQHVDKRTIKAVIEGVPSNFQDEEVVANLILNKGCYIHRSNSDEELRNEMFPLENMPLLQKEPIYRMPSVGSVMWLSSKRKDPEKDKTIINPRSCFYIFFTDCEDTKSSFETWSKLHPHFEGCCIPEDMSNEKLKTRYGGDLDTLKDALKSHGLFLYSGHGDARHYLPSDEIRKVDAGCAVCLFGCSSGYIANRRSRVPNGAPLDYLLARCPVIISNLWVVTGKYCEDLALALIGSLLKAAPANLVDCSNNEQTNFGATSLGIHQTDLASLFLGAREKVNSYRISKVDLAGTVIYGIPTRVASRNGQDLSKDHMHE